MKKVFAVTSIFAATFFLMPHAETFAGEEVWQIERIQCDGGGEVYRCRFDGSSGCDFGGQKHCDEVSSIN
ncbi:hypothetical protein [Algoriphagus antarcticus]|uniref:Uncharacterized protein n=1 Tax=Algoriphagus antarcticus TaxID=238540 RepID=A0A3E0E1A9_9BACT|nr:hypothetical protein [Algoriphagus antarcticus]REG91991.1 hypothetical protein C8N25_10368 [Algoriphagus antarcticus]